MLAHNASLAGITEYGLPNGLRVLLIPDPSQPTVTVNLTIFAGSAYEDYGETGAAHLLEHLAFKGTPEFEDPPAALNEHGASWNGTTWTDRTNYYETMPASDDNLEFGVRFEASRLMRCYIRRDDLLSEMTVVRNEFEAGENHPTQVLSERLISTAFLFHGYGHPSIGARSDIENIPIDRLQRFYERWYRPDNAMLVIAGRFDDGRARALVEEHFGALARPAAPLRKPYTVEPAQDGERAVTLRRVGEVGAVAAVYHAPGAAHPDIVALEVASEVLAATPTGRLYREMVEKGEAVRASSMVLLFREPGLIEFMVEARKDADLDEVGGHMLRLVEGLAEEPPTVAEVERGRNALLADRTLVFGNSERLAIEMSEWAAMGDWRLFFAHYQALERVAPDDVIRVASAYLRRDNRTLGYYRPVDTPGRVEVPATGDIAAQLRALATDDATLHEPEALDVDAELLDRRTSRITACDGRVALAMLPRRTRGGLVNGRILLPVGTAAGLVGKFELNDVVAGMLERGTRDRDRTRLKDDFDRLRADVRVMGGVNDTSVRFTTTSDHVVEVVEVLLELLRWPRFDEREFELLKRERLAEIEESSHEPYALAGAALGNHLYPPDHSRHAMLLNDLLSYVAELPLADVRAFHDRFYGADRAYLALSGDFDAARVVAAVGAGLGDWRSRDGSYRIDPACPPPAKPLDQVIHCPDKENALSAAARTFAMTRGDRRYVPLLLANYMLGGEALASRLSVRLRQKDGLCYGAGSNVTVDMRGDLGTFSFWAISAPQNADRVVAGFREELARCRDDGFDDDELERAKRVYLEQIDVRLARDSALAAEMLEQMIRGCTFAELARIQDGVRAATAADVADVVRELLDPEQMSLVRAGDFQRAQERS